MKQQYFSHDRDARSDPKIVKVRRKYGMEGYGLYFALLEMLYSQTDCRLPYDDDQFDAIAYDLRTDVDMREFVDFCTDKGLFRHDSQHFWSDSMLRRIDEATDKSNRRREAAVAAAQARWGRVKGREPEPPADPRDLTGYDSEWLRVVKGYEAELGLFPTGTTAEKLSDYYNDMGADVMLLAIQQTNKAQPSRPVLFLQKILKQWAEQGVTTPEKARAAILDHERNAANYHRDSNVPEPPAIRGKFY